MLNVTKLTFDHETAPVGLDHAPVFGWQLTGDCRDIRQTMAQLQIAMTPDFAAPVFDELLPGKNSIAVQAAGFAPRALTRYYARVQIKADTAAGLQTSDWSAPGSFVTALLDPEREWRAAFISAEDADTCRESSAGTMVRGDFAVRPGIRAAYACTTALGLYNFYLNGTKVSTDEMTPGWTSYNRRLLYQTYDVTALLHPGTNRAGAMLGAGWYKGVMGLTRARNNYGDRTAFSMQLTLQYDDGTTEIVTTDASWQGTIAPVTFSEIYHGEEYDAALELPGWADAAAPNAAPAGRWHGVETVTYPAAQLYAQAAGKVSVRNRLPAQRIFTTPAGETVVDFGQNMAGRVEITATGGPGDVAELRCFEELDADGNAYLANLRKARTIMRYKFAQPGTVTWHPQFTYMGFRYALVVQWPGTPRAENFTAYTLHTAMEPAGQFQCSEPLVNGLHHNITWGLKSNFLDVPTDCPQRDERLGWTGDAQIFSETACWLADTWTFYTKWLTDLVADQLPDGGVTNVVPNIEEHHTEGNWLMRTSPYGMSGWADAATIIPWVVYKMYGDASILRNQYASMCRWVDFMTAHTRDDLFTFMTQLGDWVALDAEPGSFFGATPTALTSQAYYALSARILALTASVLGKAADTEKYTAVYKNAKDAFIKNFFDAEGTLTAQTQTAHILALRFDLTPEKWRAKTVQRLLQLLDERGGHLVTGFLGTPYFCAALSENDCLKQAYDLLLKKDFPGWLYQVAQGATTVWEHWDGRRPDGTMWSAGMNSFNHYAYGAVGAWLYSTVLGLGQQAGTAGFAAARLAPRPGGGLNWAEGWHETPLGRYALRWEKDAVKTNVTFSVPANAEAELVLEPGAQVIATDGIAFTNGTARVGSGTYTVQYAK